MLIKRIDATRLDDCLALAVSRNWAPSAQRWSLLFEIGAVYGIDDPDGGLAGCVVATKYGPHLSGIGMMLVAEKFGRQGLGTRLMQHAVDKVGTGAVWLTATEYGRPLYEKLGFRTIGTYTRYQGHLRLAASGASASASTKDMAAVGRLDATVFGAPRDHVLRRIEGIR